MCKNIFYLESRVEFKFLPTERKAVELILLILNTMKKIYFEKLIMR